MRTHGEHQAHHESHENLNTSSEAHKSHEHIQDHVEAKENDPLQQSIEAIKARADREAKSAHEFEKHDVDNAPVQSLMLHRELKDNAYQQSLQKTRRYLSAPERLFSKAIHQPAVEAVSEVAANTIGRASGLFAGSLFALIGSTFLLYMSKRYGFTYNYGVFMLCFIGGFALGLLVELAWRTVRKPR